MNVMIAFVIMSGVFAQCQSYENLLWDQSD